MTLRQIRNLQAAEFKRGLKSNVSPALAPAETWHDRYATRDKKKFDEAAFAKAISDEAFAAGSRSKHAASAS